MSREDDFATRMTGDATLMAILTGGVFKRGSVGLEGITRESAASAFDTAGFLKPCALVAQRGNIPDGVVKDFTDRSISGVQVVEIYVYQDRIYDKIDLALERLKVLFLGYQFTGTFELYLANVIDRQRDMGALKGASLARQDWAVHNIS
jgi:hypothetical protein